MLWRKLFLFFCKYFFQLRIAFHELQSLFGFFIFLIILNQIVSGVMLSFSFIPESMFVFLSREEEICENFYIDDFLFLHERGVDFLIIFLYLHICRKIYDGIYTFEQEFAWKHGVLLYLLTHIVIFFGLLLSCTHLSEITLTIVSQIFYTFCLFIGKVEWIVLTDRLLNDDTLVRVAYLHYCLAFILLFFGLYHGLDMHYDWKNELHFDGLEEEMCWYDEGFISEVSQFLNSCAIISILCLFLYMQPEVITYELFTWGDIGMSTDVRFFGVAPHWYFRPFMSWLIICPFYYLGLLGLLLFFISFYFQPNIVSFSELYHYSGYSSLISFFFPRFSNKHRRFVFISRKDGKSGLLNIWMFGLFCASLWYVFSYLPYGRFFNSIGGNNASLIAYLYIYFYMCGGFFRSSFFSFNLPL